MNKFTRMALAVGLAAGLTVGAVSQAQAGTVQRSCSPPEDLDKVWLTVKKTDPGYTYWSATKYYEEPRAFLPDQRWYFRYINFQGDGWSSTAASGSRRSTPYQKVIGHWREETNGLPGVYTFWNCGVSL